MNIDKSKIKPNTPVVCSEGGQFATVDHLAAGDTIQLMKDGKGQAHFIPMKWVTSVDEKVHIDRPGGQAMKEWATTAPPFGGTPTAPKAVSPNAKP